MGKGGQEGITHVIESEQFQFTQHLYFSTIEHELVIACNFHFLWFLWLYRWAFQVVTTCHTLSPDYYLEQ